MAVTPGGKAEVSALVLHGKAGAAQTQCLTQGCAGNGLSADGERFCVTGGGLFDRAEPAFRCGEIGRDAKAGKSLLHLRGRKYSSILIIISGKVGAAVHRDQIGQGGAPHIFAGLRPAVGNGKVAGAGGGVIVKKEIVQNLVHKGREPGIVLLVGGAPVTAQHRFGQTALTPGRINGEPCTALQGGMIPAVERIGVGGNSLCLECFVRPADRHFGGDSPQNVFPAGKLHYLSGGLILSAAWIVLTIGCIVYAYTHKVSEGYRRLAGFVSAGYVVYILLYLLTDMPFNERYGLLNTVLSVPLFAVALKEVRVKEHVKKAVTAVFLAAVAAGCVLLLVRMDGVDETLEKRVIADKMVAEGYENGYATFWNGNVMTELSGGKIQMWVWRDATLDQHGPDVDEIYPWLQLTSHDTERPTGKVFVLFSREEFENNPWKQNLQPEDVIYESEEYVVLGYPDYETMKATLEKDL